MLGILAIKSFFRYLTTHVFTSDNRRYNTGLFFHKYLQWSNNVCWIKNSVANLKAIFQLKIRNLLIVKIWRVRDLFFGEIGTQKFTVVI